MVSSALNRSGNSDTTCKIRANIRFSGSAEEPKEQTQVSDRQTMLNKSKQNEGGDGEGGISPVRVQTTN